MPDLPRQVKRVTRQGLSLLLAAAAMVAGCASADRSVRRAFQTVHFPAPNVEPRIAVYGDLRRLLPSFNRTPVIDLWLYGPNDFGKTVLRNPQGMALLGSRVLVCDQGQSEIVAIDLATGKSVFWGDANHQPRCPVALAVDGQSNVHVADTTLRSVLRYGPDGRFIEEQRPAGRSADAFRPTCVMFHGEILYVGNAGDRRIDRRDMSSGQWLEPLVPPADFPPVIAPTGLAMTADGVLLIADAVTSRVLRFSPDGRWLDPIGRPGRQDGEFVRPKQICATGSGLILVTDAGRQSIAVFDREGRFVTEVRERQGAWAGMTMPAGLLVVSPGLLPLLSHEGDDRSATPCDYVIVSDSLSDHSLILLGVFAQCRREPSDGR